MENLPQNNSPVNSNLDPPPDDKGAKTKHPPQDEGAEMGCLASMMLDDEVRHKIITESGLEPDDFYMSGNPQIFAVLKELHNEGSEVDLLIVRDALKQRDLFEKIGGAAYLGQLVETVPSAANGVYYSKIVKRHAASRACIRFAVQLDDAGHDLIPVDGQLDKLLVDFIALADGQSYEKPVICAADVTPEVIQYLWPKRFPLGKIVTLVGNPGAGKSMISREIAAIVSSGRSWPNTPDDPRSPADVLIVSLEDSISDAIVPSLIKQGYDKERVHFVRTDVHLANHKRPFSLTEDIPLLGRYLDNLKDPKLLIIDTLTACMGQTRQEKAAEVLGVLGQLTILADRIKLCALLLHHNRKSKSLDPLDNILGSGSFGAQSRATFHVYQDKTDPTGERRVMLPGKANYNTTSGIGLGFTIGEGGVVKTEETPLFETAGEQLEKEHQQEHQEKRTDAMDWLECQLENGPVEKGTLEQSAKADGFDWWKIKMAYQRLKVIGEKGFGKAATWRLPDKGQQK